jgi:hypothetical protein
MLNLQNLPYYFLSIVFVPLFYLLERLLPFGKTTSHRIVKSLAISSEILYAYYKVLDAEANLKGTVGFTTEGLLRM